MSSPYRTAAVIDAVETGAVSPDAWRRYRKGCLVYTCVRRTVYLAVAAALYQGSTLNLFAFLVVYPMLVVMALPLVTHAKCPFCFRDIARGPAQASYWSVVTGHYPKSCTHCGAEVGATRHAPAPPPPAGSSKKRKPLRRRDPKGRRLARQVLLNLDA